MKPIPIIIPTYNSLPYLRRCIESIHAFTNFSFSPPYRLIILENACTDGTREYLQTLGRTVNAIHNRENLGWIKGVNQGLKLALAMDPDYIIFANDDIMIPGDPMWLARFTGLLSNPEVGAVGPVSNYVMGLQKHIFNLPPIHEAKFLIGFFFATKAEVIRKVGFLDERFGTALNDDLDISIRIRKAGYKLLINRTAFIFHYGSKTLASLWGGAEGFKSEDERTRALLVEKWGQDVVNELFAVPEGLL